MSKHDELKEKLKQVREKLAKSAMNQGSSRRPVNGKGIPAGWSQDAKTGAFHHSMHGVISTTKHPDGYYQISHAGRSVGRANNIADAGARIRTYMSSLHSHDTAQHNVDPMNMAKEEMDKSNYGPKGAAAYRAEDNVKRKENRTNEEIEGAGPNKAVHKLSSAPMGSAKQQAAAEASKTKKLSGPVKQYTPAQIAAINEARKLKKNAEENNWVQHAAIPNADEEVQNLQKTNPAVPAEDLMANQLANLMQGKAMLNQPPKQPSSEEMLMAGQAMGLGVTEEMIKSEEQQWGGTINNWLAEASKPISSRFNSPEEEDAYWANLRVADRGGNEGY